MSDFGPNGMFDHLDDPTPPAFGDDLLPGVRSRGHQIRRQRQTAYAIGSACAVVVIAGASIGLVGTTSNGSQPPTATLATATARPTRI